MRAGEQALIICLGSRPRPKGPVVATITQSDVSSRQSCRYASQAMGNGCTLATRLGSSDDGGCIELLVGP